MNEVSEQERELFMYVHDSQLVSLTIISEMRTNSYKKSQTLYYVRSRNFDPKYGIWNTVDPLWPGESAYKYVNGRISTFSDPSGLRCGETNDCCKDEADQGNNGRGDLAHHCSNGKWGINPPKEIHLPCTKNSCSAITGRLTQITGTVGCSYFCNKAKKPVPDPESGEPVTYPDGSPWGAATFCCYNNDGSLKKCTLWCRSPQDKDDPCVSRCLSMHEDRHKKQPGLWRCPGSENNFPVPVRPPKGNRFAWGECDAYQVEVHCLIEQARKFGSQSCALEITTLPSSL